VHIDPVVRRPRLAGAANPSVKNEKRYLSWQ
jgi:hypothetical protein